jgi:hypothetical protein
LDIYNCDTKMLDNIYTFDCHPGEPGCGSHNQEWVFSTNGSMTSLRTQLDGTCVTADGDGLLSTTACSGADSQAFYYDARDSTIRNHDGSRCLSGHTAWPGNNITVQVFARPLASGAIAVAVFNRAAVSPNFPFEHLSFDFFCHSLTSRLPGFIPWTNHRHPCPQPCPGRLLGSLHARQRPYVTSGFTGILERLSNPSPYVSSLTTRLCLLCKCNRNFRKERRALFLLLISGCKKKVITW